MVRKPRVSIGEQHRDGAAETEFFIVDGGLVPPSKCLIFSSGVDFDHYAAALVASLIHPPLWQKFHAGAVGPYAVTPKAWNEILAAAE